MHLSRRPQEHLCMLPQLCIFLCAHQEHLCIGLQRSMHLFLLQWQDLHSCRSGSNRRLGPTKQVILLCMLVSQLHLLCLSIHAQRSIGFRPRSRHQEHVNMGSSRQVYQLCMFLYRLHLRLCSQTQPNISFLLHQFYLCTAQLGSTLQFYHLCMLVYHLRLCIQTQPSIGLRPDSHPQEHLCKVCTQQV